MQIEKLEYVVEVARTGSISSAARNLHVTLPAVSQAISGLEADLSITLFTRSRSGAVPTAEGKLFIKKAAELLAKYEELKDTARSVSANLTGELRIATIPAHMRLFVDAVMGFRADYPGVSLDIEEKGTQEILDDIRHNRSDIGLIILSGETEFARDDTALQFERLREVRMVAAVHRRSPLAFQSSLSPEELLASRIVLYKDEYVLWYMKSYEACYGKADIVFTTNNTEAIRSAMKHHGAVTIGLDYSFEGEMARESAVLLDIRLPKQTPVHIGWVRPAGKKPSQAARLFINRLQHHLRQEAEGRE